MPELDDTYLRAALRDLHNSALPAIRRPALEEVEHLARRRQGTQTAGLVSLSVLLLIGAIALANLTKPPPVGPDPTQTPTLTLTSTTTPTPAPVTTTPATIGAGELANAMVAMPFRPGTCSREALQYSNGQHEVRRTTPDGNTDIWTSIIHTTARADVNGDGTAEIIAKVSCSNWEDPVSHVVALRPNSNGGWETLGVVVAESTATQDIGDVAVTSAGETVVTVSSHRGLTLSPLELPAITQQRTYGWTGQGFAQTAGPTTFAADPAVASFTVAAAPVVLGDASGGYREGTITVTVRANGPLAIPAALVVATVSERRPGGFWDRCGPDSDKNWSVCDLGVLAVGATTTLNLPVRISADLSLGPGDDIAAAAVQLDQFEYEPVTIRVANP